MGTEEGSTSLRLLHLERGAVERHREPKPKLYRNGMRTLKARWSAAPSVGAVTGAKGNERSFMPSTITQSESNSYGVSDWVQRWQRIKEKRAREVIAWEREQTMVAKGFLAQLILKHWHKTAKILGIWRKCVQKTALSYGFSSWLVWLREAQAYGQLGLSMGRKLRCTLPAARAFDTWRRFARGDRLRSLLNTWRAGQLAKAFRTWVQVLEALSLLGQALTAVLRAWLRRTGLCTAWSKWKCYTRFLSLCLRAIMRWQQAHLAPALTQWKIVTLTQRCTSHRFHDIASHFLMRLKLRSLARAWTTWKYVTIRPRKIKKGHCSCVYRGNMRRRTNKCICKPEDHLRWRLMALRKNLDKALLSAPPTRPPSIDYQRPPLDSTKPDRLYQWNQTRQAALAASQAKHEALVHSALYPTSTTCIGKKGGPNRLQAPPVSYETALHLIETPTVEIMNTKKATVLLSTGDARRNRGAASSISKNKHAGSRSTPKRHSMSYW